MRTFIYGGVDFTRIDAAPVSSAALTARRPALDEEILSALFAPAVYRSGSEAWFGGLWALGQVETVEALTAPVPADWPPQPLAEAPADLPAEPPAEAPLALPISVPDWAGKAGVISLMLLLLWAALRRMRPW